MTGYTPMVLTLLRIGYQSAVIAQHVAEVENEKAKGARSPTFWRKFVDLVPDGDE